VPEVLCGKLNEPDRHQCHDGWGQGVVSWLDGVMASVNKKKTSALSTVHTNFTTVGESHEK
jgi:hypothetical protein